MTLPVASAREALVGVGAVLQLIQPRVAVLAGAQSNNHVDVAAAQLEAVAFGTQNIDSQGREVPHVALDPEDATFDPIMNHLGPKLIDGFVSCAGCCINSCCIFIVS